MSTSVGMQWAAVAAHREGEKNQAVPKPATVPLRDIISLNTAGLFGGKGEGGVVAICTAENERSLRFQKPTQTNTNTH